MKAGFKRVPAIDRCFSILGLCARTESPVGISEISRSLHINKSTVYNAVYTLADLGILESTGENKFRFGTALYLLGREAGRRSELIQMVHPYLQLPEGIVPKHSALLRRIAEDIETRLHGGASGVSRVG